MYAISKTLWVLSLYRNNCREEFQIHDKIQSSNYSMGRISDLLPEHYLVLVCLSFFEI